MSEQGLFVLGESVLGGGYVSWGNVRKRGYDQEENVVQGIFDRGVWMKYVLKKDGVFLFEDFQGGVCEDVDGFRKVILVIYGDVCQVIVVLKEMSVYNVQWGKRFLLESVLEEMEVVLQLGI